MRRILRSQRADAPGVDDVDAAAQDRDGSSAGVERPVVGGGVDASGQAADDHQTRPRRGPRASRSAIARPAGRWPSRPDNGHRGPVQHVGSPRPTGRSAGREGLRSGRVGRPPTTSDGRRRAAVGAGQRRRGAATGRCRGAAGAFAALGSSASASSSASRVRRRSSVFVEEPRGAGVEPRLAGATRRPCSSKAASCPGLVTVPLRCSRRATSSTETVRSVPIEPSVQICQSVGGSALAEFAMSSAGRSSRTRVTRVYIG